MLGDADREELKSIKASPVHTIKPKNTNELLRLQHKNPKKVIGLISGTSADGIDACLCGNLSKRLTYKNNVLALKPTL